MKKLLLLLLLPITVFANPYQYPITRVIDGDTVAFKVDYLPPELGQELSLRIYGVDTPEKGGRAQCSQENARGWMATKFTTDVVSKATQRLIIIRDWDKFGGRVLGDLILDGKNLKDLLISNGLAREYYGDKKTSWCTN